MLTQMTEPSQFIQNYPNPFNPQAIIFIVGRRECIAESVRCSGQEQPFG